MDYEKLIRDYRGALPVQVEALIENMGLGLERTALANDISGHIKREPDGHYIIRVNEGEHEYRQRFTMAHELGHFILHKSILERTGGINDNTMYRADRSAPAYNADINEIHERQANSFAANLLMPDEAVREKWMEFSEQSNHPEHWVSLTDMHRFFRVSPSAMRWKCRNMGLEVYG